jgi:hypothetical protein
MDLQAPGSLSGIPRDGMAVLSLQEVLLWDWGLFIQAVGVTEMAVHVGLLAGDGLLVGEG